MCETFLVQGNAVYVVCLVQVVLVSSLSPSYHSEQTSDIMVGPWRELNRTGLTGQPSSD